MKTVWANAHVGSNPTLSARHCKIPKLFKLRDFLYLSMVHGIFASYMFHRNHTKINVAYTRFNLQFYVKIYDNFVMRF